MKEGPVQGKVALLYKYLDVKEGVRAGRTVKRLIKGKESSRYMIKDRSIVTLYQKGIVFL